ncbi:MAG: outer membrane beta-barrel protein [Betaproteobacteria bacterium]|nr:outer membrane beta-barrel protein [Betaproteobacteria bacterium]
MRKQALAAAIAALSLSGIAAAHEPGDIVLRVGVTYADPDVSSSRIEWNGVSQPGTSLRNDGGSNTQLGLGMTYMIVPHFGLEATITTPFSHKFKSRWAGVDYSNGEVSRLSPTISAQYFFLNPKSNFQPYVGLGVNYSMFYNEKLSSEAKNDFGANNLKIKNSFGLAGQIGMDYTIGNRLVLNASVWKMGISAKATWRENWGAGEERMKADIDIDPWVYFLGIGYKF